MSAKKDVLYRKRRWLNPLRGMGDAYVSAELRRDEWPKEEGGPLVKDVYGNVSITDCSRKINLSFSDDRDSVKKINKLIGVLEEFREALVEEIG